MSQVEKETRSYLANFSRSETAKAYQERCLRETGKRHREYEKLGELLAAHGPFERVLDMPCGGGRFFDLLKANSRSVVGADASRAQLEGAVQTQSLSGAVRALQANAAHLPFKDASFDCAMSIRFFHHLHSGAARIEALKELARVSLRHVLVTFYDYMRYGLVKSAIGRFRGNSKKINLKSVAVSRFALEGAKAGLKVVKVVHFHPGSQSIFVLFEKCPQAAAEFLKKPETLSRRLRLGRTVERMLPAILGAMALVCFFVDLDEVEKGAFNWAAGLPLLALGALLLGGGLFFKNKCAQSPFQPEGPYKVVRHPIVAGAIVWMAALSAMCEILWFVPIAAVLLYFSFGPFMELAEARMFLKHENAYDEYCAETPRLFPYFRALKNYVFETFLAICRLEGAPQYVYPALFFAAGVLFAIAKELYWDHIAPLH